MDYSLKIKQEALSDISDATEWYESRQEDLGNEFSETVFNYFEYLASSAHSHPKVKGEYRELVMKRFPYVIVYRIAKEKEVVILGVIHTKKHPAKRRKRK